MDKLHGNFVLCTGYEMPRTDCRNIENVSGEHEDRFRPRRCEAEQIFTVKPLLERAWEHNIGIQQYRQNILQNNGEM